MDQQSIQSLLGGSESQNQQQLVNQLIDKVQPQLQLLITISIVLSIIIVVLMLVNWLYKWRVERAILRMDKNLQILVDKHVDVSSNEKGGTKFTPEKQTEQK
ncbi:MAG: hypothetical protein H6797_04530 [Candidatus Nomurabacteria bacterium]|nr:MAG: hypothetical protein H6797_04530 [Candidatus Nomurabacteria bacterium]